MKIAIASGKGGTGKTTVATSLALSLVAESERTKTETVSIPPLFLDCDVEAPNAHLFLNPVFEVRQEIGILIPQIDESKCTSCGKCAEVCQYHAIAVLGKKVLVFPQLCHGCGSCTWNCPEGAISEILNEMGVLEKGRTSSGIDFAHGILNIGEPMAVPIIRQLKKWKEANPEQIVILDAPPGSSCPVVETVRGADFLLLVTEPTPFGLHDLRLMAEVGRALGIPAGVIINRDGIGDTAVERYCERTGLPILMRIPLDRQIADGLARGIPLVRILPEYLNYFSQLYEQIQSLAVNTYARALDLD